MNTKYLRREGELEGEITLPPLSCSKYVIIGNPRKRRQRKEKTPMWEPYGGKPIFMLPKNKIDKYTIYGDKYFEKPDEEDPDIGQGKITHYEEGYADDTVEMSLLPRLSGIHISSKAKTKPRTSSRRKRRRRRKVRERSPFMRFTDKHLLKSGHYCDVLGPNCCGLCNSKRARNLAAAKSYESLPVVELTAASLVAPTLASQLMKAAKWKRSSQSRKKNRDAFRKGTRGLERLPKIASQY